MYLVISRWKPKPGHESDFEEAGRSMRGILKGLPGVRMVEGIQGPDSFHVVHVYEDEEAYRRVVDDPHGPFARAAQEHMLDEVAEWLGSVSGPTLD